jgi:predicted Zn-dependent protease with MMP-like domain
MADGGERGSQLTGQPIGWSNEIGTADAGEKDAELKAAFDAQAARAALEAELNDRFEAFVTEAIDGLPGPFREQLDSVAIVIEEEPSQAQLASVGAHMLLGLYQGVPRTAFGAENAPVASKITVFRGPLLRSYRSAEALRAGVAETVRHEVAHHLGISDARLMELAREHRG